MDTIAVGRRLVLHLGVVVVPYRTRTGKVTGLTTADVAHFLEKKYDLMATFYIRKEAKIAKAIESSGQGALEAMMMGAPQIDPWGRAMGQIEQMFRRAINTRETEAWGILGVPTKAAQMGVNHRLVHPYARRGSRPSFRDTGTYSAAFKAWVDGSR